MDSSSDSQCHLGVARCSWAYPGAAVTRSSRRRSHLLHHGSSGRRSRGKVSRLGIRRSDTAKNSHSRVAVVGRAAICTLCNTDHHFAAFTRLQFAELGLVEMLFRSFPRRSRTPDRISDRLAGFSSTGAAPGAWSTGSEKADKWLDDRGIDGEVLESKTRVPQHAH